MTKKSRIVLFLFLFCLLGGGVLYFFIDSESLEKPTAKGRMFEILNTSISPSDQLEDYGILYTGEGVKICIIDTGIDYTSLGVNVYGYDFVNNDNDPMDDHGHGTQVAYIIHSVAPKSEIIMVKVMNSEGIGHESDVIKGIDYCINAGANIISLSIGAGHFDGYCDSDPVAAKANEAVDMGIFVAAAIGEPLKVPACASNVTRVGSIDFNDNIVQSNPMTDVLGFGKDISTITLGGKNVLVSGTSMAVSFVSAGAALLLSEEPMSPQQIKDRFKSTAKIIETDSREYYKINIPAALEALDLNKPMDYEASQSNNKGDGTFRVLAGQGESCGSSGDCASPLICKFDYDGSGGWCDAESCGCWHDGVEYAYLAWGPTCLTTGGGGTAGSRPRCTGDCISWSGTQCGYGDFSCSSGGCRRERVANACSGGACQTGGAGTNYENCNSAAACVAGDNVCRATSMCGYGSYACDGNCRRKRMKYQCNGLGGLAANCIREYNWEYNNCAQGTVCSGSTCSSGLCSTGSWVCDGNCQRDRDSLSCDGGNNCTYNVHEDQNCAAGTACSGGTCGSGTYCDTADHCTGNTYYSNRQCNGSNSCTYDVTDIGCCQSSKCSSHYYCQESNHACTYLTTCAEANSGFGYNPQESNEDLWNECTQGSNTSYGCRSNYCSGSSYACGAQTSGDGGCPNCYTCSDPDIACEYHNEGTVDGCTGTYTCSGFTKRYWNACNGTGSCADVDSGAADCSGTCASYCVGGSCINTDTDPGTCTASTNARVSSDGDGHCTSAVCESDGSANGESCIINGDCASNNCRTGSDRSNKYCAANDKECGQSGGDGYDTNEYDNSANAKCIGTDTWACKGGYYYTSSCIVADIGWYSLDGDDERTQCATGYYGSSTTNSASTCDDLCLAGYYGSSTGNTTSTCDGECTAGYYCLAGSISATENECGLGNYCPSGSGSATPCDVDSYSAVTTAISCTACPSDSDTNGVTGSDSDLDCSCDGGYYDATGDAYGRGCIITEAGYYSVDNDNTHSQCTAGYYCLAGSISATQNECGLGNYCPFGSGSATPCPAGTYGSTTTLTSPVCTDVCTAGYYCLAGSTSATENECGLGNYCPSGSGSATPCPAGTYGSATTLAVSTCDGECTAGYYCPAGSISATENECPVNNYCLAAIGSPTPCPSNSSTNGATGQDEEIDCQSVPEPISQAMPGGYVRSLKSLEPEKPILVQEVIDRIGEEVQRISERAKEIARLISRVFLPIMPPIVEEIKPPEVPIEELVSKEAPLVFQGKWQLLPSGPIREFVLSPLPKEIIKLAKKFPELGETLKKVGITKITDIGKLKTVKLILPGLKESEEMPTEIVFAKTGGELINLNIALTINEKGEAEQRISTISGKPLQLTIKPDKPAKSVKGYVVFKSKMPRPTSFQFPFNLLTASLIFANPVFAQPQENPVRVEEKLVLLEFEYTGPDGDGIYTAEIQAPIVEGEYEIITVMDFEDPELGKKEIRLIAVVDPEGYIYEKDGDKETRIPGAIVSIYWLNPETKQYELWVAKEYQQENPQTTDVRGTYSFLVPEGSYYLKVEAPGYLVYDGKPFQVKEGSGVNINIELETKYLWLKIVDWKILALILVIILLFCNFYRDKIRKKLLRK